MWFYPVCLGTLIPGGLLQIAPCSSPLLGRLAVIAILRSGSRGLDCRSFHFSHAPVLTVGNTIELLVGCSRGQFARHWSGAKLDQQWYCTGLGPQQSKIRPPELPALP